MATAIFEPISVMHPVVGNSDNAQLAITHNGGVITHIDFINGDNEHGAFNLADRNFKIILIDLDTNEETLLFFNNQFCCELPHSLITGHIYSIKTLYR